MVASLFGLTAVFLGVAALERVDRLRFAPSPFFRPHLATDVGWYVLATGSSLATALVLRPALSGLRMADVGSLPGSFLAGLVLYDGVAFVVHVAIHRVGRLWEVHKVHHSSLRLDWLATTRTHMAEHMVRNLPAQVVLMVLGFPVTTMTAVAGVYAAFAVLGHSNLDVDLRWSERLFVTPRLHRIHHVPATTQRNFATVFSVWDRMVGTLVVDDVDPSVAFGVPGEVDTYPQRLRDALREPFRR
jgi:sterol desaturase/sphingolipid hydroxylase (fatty acid hydroxylase superfamily)